MNANIYLQELGFSQIEIKLYIILLKSGPSSVTRIAERAKLNRTAAYQYINSLLQKGIIAKVKGEKSKIAANPPENLRYLVEQKTNTVKNLEVNLPLVIKSLNTILPDTKSNSTSEMRYYKGRIAVKSIYEDCLKSTIVKAYFNAKDLAEIFPENVALFEKAIINTPDMIVYELVEQSQEATKIITYEKRTTRHMYKFLPEDIKLTSNDILIYDGKVAIINIGDKQNVTGVILQNQDYYNNSVQLFDLLWRLLPESNAV